MAWMACVVLDFSPVSPGAYGLVLRHVVGSTLLQTERTDAEFTLMFCEDMTPEGLSSCEGFCMAVRVIACVSLTRLSAAACSGSVSGRYMALQRRRRCEFNIAVLTALHLRRQLNVRAVVWCCEIRLTWTSPGRRQEVRGIRTCGERHTWLFT